MPSNSCIIMYYYTSPAMCSGGFYTISINLFCKSWYHFLHLGAVLTPIFKIFISIEPTLSLFRLIHSLLFSLLCPSIYLYLSLPFFCPYPPTFAKIPQILPLTPSPPSLFLTGYTYANSVGLPSTHRIIISHRHQSSSSPPPSLSSTSSSPPTVSVEPRNAKRDTHTNIPSAADSKTAFFLDGRGARRRWKGGFRNELREAGRGPAGAGAGERGMGS